MTPIEIGFLTILAKTILTSAHFGPFGRHQFCLKKAPVQWSLLEDISLLTTQTQTIRREALRFATQISPLLN